MRVSFHHFRIQILSFALALAPNVAVAIEPPTEATIERELERFDSAPFVYMNTLPPKSDVVSSVPEALAHGEEVQALPPRLTSLASVEAKDETRDLILKGVSPSLKSGAKQDVSVFLDPAELLGTDGRIVRDLNEIERLGFTRLTLDNKPWSDSYWPMYRGLIGQRYGSNKFSAAGPDWKGFFDFIRSPGFTLLSIYRSLQPSRRDDLSPAEKYDLLIGDLSDSSQGYLTQANWARGARVYRRNGEVATWMGICHGWAPASFMYPRPTKTITVTAADGRTPLTLYPSDIKALASEMWSYSSPRVRFLGRRCNVKNPERDGNGRVIDERCHDTNPGMWHLAVVNQLGSARRNLVFDATYDHEVWNQPLVAASYTYFNPITRKPSGNLAAATVALRAHRRDPFRRYRSPDAVAVVGIAMKVRYLNETKPSQRPTDDPSRDAFREVTYLYDLEIDNFGRVIGGEWYRNGHPDFLWVPPRHGRALSEFEAQAQSDWDGLSVVPEDWRQAANLAARQTQPLGRLVEALIERSASATDHDGTGEQRD